MRQSCLYLSLFLCAFSYAKPDYVKLANECDESAMDSCQKVYDGCEKKRDKEACFVWGVHSDVANVPADRVIAIYQKACLYGKKDACDLMRSKQRDAQNQAQNEAYQGQQLEMAREANAAQTAQVDAARRANNIQATRAALQFFTTPAQPQPTKTNCQFNAFFNTMDCSSQ